MVLNNIKGQLKPIANVSTGYLENGTCKTKFVGHFLEISQINDTINLFIWDHTFLVAVIFPATFMEK